MPRGVARRDPAARPAVDRGIPVAIVDVLLDTLGVDEEEITPDSKLCDDLGADSLDIVELQIALEKTLKLSAAGLDDEVAERWMTGTVRDLLADVAKARS